MKTLFYSIFAIFCIIFIFSNNAVFADNIKSTDSFLQKCNDNILPIPTLKPASVNSSNPKLGILVMQPNSVAKVCIKYVKLSHGNSSFETNNTQLIPSVGIENTRVQGNQISFGSIPVNNVVAKASQKIISFGSQENASTVILYTLSAKPDSVGYYHVGIPYMCGNILLAVGFPETQIDASAFQDVNPMCFNFGLETPIVGIQGANMTYVDISNKTIHSTKLPENISIIPPLQQMRIYDVKFIQCNPDLQLIFKLENGSPACVKLDTAYMLIKRGWATSESAYPGGDAQFALGTNSTIIPAHLPRSSGLRIPYYESSRVINYSSFDGIYNETFPYRGMQMDYVLKPGSTGVITFKLEAVASEQQDQDYSIPLPKSLNLTNYAIFYHEITNLEDLSKYPGVTFSENDHYGGFTVCSTGPAGTGSCIGGESSWGTNSIEAFVTDHPGVDVLFEPPSEVLPLSMNATSHVITMMISVDSNAPRGTYLVILPSVGVDSFLLTVGDRPYHE